MNGEMEMFRDEIGGGSRASSDLRRCSRAKGRRSTVGPSSSVSHGLWVTRCFMRVLASKPVEPLVTATSSRRYNACCRLALQGTDMARRHATSHSKNIDPGNVDNSAYTSDVLAENSGSILGDYLVTARSNAELRRFLLAALEAAGYGPLTRVPGRRAALYLNERGQKFWLKTMKVRRRAVMSIADGRRVEDRISFENYGVDFVAFAVNGRNAPDPEGYCVLAPRVAADMRENHEHADAPNSKVRILYLDGDPEKPGRGFAQKYAEFRLSGGGADRVDHPAASPTASATTRRHRIEVSVRDDGRVVIEISGIS